MTQPLKKINKMIHKYRGIFKVESQNFLDPVLAKPES